MQQLGAKKADEKSIKVRQMKRTRTPIIEQRRGTIVVVAFLWRRVRIVVVVVKGARRYDGAIYRESFEFFQRLFSLTAPASSRYLTHSFTSRSNLIFN